MSEMKKKEMIVENVKKIISEYTMRLTLRQIYYRLVSKHIIPNVMNEYKYLSKVLVDARLKRQIPFTAMEDRTRGFIGKDIAYEEAEDYHDKWLEWYKECAEDYKLPRWQNQPKYVEVWVEKEALSGLFNQVTEKAKVTLAPCRGYPSLTFMYEMACRLKYQRKPIEILYFGDLDPSGEDIYRVVRDYFATFGITANFEKIAITTEQIEEYDIPPMPTKRTDSRAAGFIEEYGDIAVELDAIEPDKLQEIIREAIAEHFDEDIHDEVLNDEEGAQEEIGHMIEETLGGDEE